MACTGTCDKSEHAAWITGAACRCICNAEHVVHDIWRTLYSEMKPQNGVIELSAGGKQVMRSCGGAGMRRAVQGGVYYERRNRIVRGERI